MKPETSYISKYFRVHMVFYFRQVLVQKGSRGHCLYDVNLLWKNHQLVDCKCESSTGPSSGGEGRSGSQALPVYIAKILKVHLIA